MPRLTYALSLSLSIIFSARIFVAAYKWYYFFALVPLSVRLVGETTKKAAENGGAETSSSAPLTHKFSVGELLLVDVEATRKAAATHVVAIIEPHRRAEVERIYVKELRLEPGGVF